MADGETASVEALMRELEELQEKHREIEELREKAREATRRRREAEEDADRARKRVEEAEKRMQDTTIEEYLNACQKHIFDRLKVENNLAREPQGDLTNPTKKWSSTKLLPWTDFLDEQKKVLGKFYEVFPLHERLFLSVEALKYAGEVFIKGNIKDEAHVGHVQRVAVQVPVARIIEEIVKRRTVRDALGVSSDVKLQNHVLPGNKNMTKSVATLIKINEPNNETNDAVNNQADNEADNQTDNDIDNGTDNEADNEEEDEDVGGADDKTPLNRFEYDAERLIEADITQTFRYMAQNGLQYSYLTTSEAFVFLKIDWRNPRNLYFHLAEHFTEAAAHGDKGRHCTAVSQVLAFSLLALRAHQKRRADRMRARKRAELKKCQPTLRTDGLNTTNRDDDDSVDELTMDTPTTPITNLGSVRSSRFNTPAKTSNSRQGSSHRLRNRSYCTQQCLLGLVSGLPLDPHCPNIDLHRYKTPDSDQHPVDHKTWWRLLAKQFYRRPGAGLRCLWKEGVRGVLIQVTLLKYGYTFVAKATNRESIEHLRREARMYERLRSLQGSDIPVFSGRLRLHQPYDYDYGMQVVYLLFLSWGGESVLAKKAELGMDQAALNGQLLPLLRRVHGLGVVHMDVRGENVLWCEETRRVMLIDFERSVTVCGDRDRDPVRERVVQWGIQEDLGVAGIIIEPPSWQVYPYLRF